MIVVLAVLVGLLGLAVGSFLNVVVARVPRGESVRHPRSRCPACGARLRPRDNVPVLSWVFLRGRCRDCSAAISVRYPTLELLTAALFAAAALRFGPRWELPAYLYLVAVGVALAAIDLEIHRLPDRLTLPSYAVGVTLLGVGSLAAGDVTSLWRALLGMAAGVAVYFALAIAYPGGMGLGDVKLAGVLGLYTAWLGWGSWAVALFAGFLLGGLVAITLVALGRAGRKTAVPFGPFMVVGALVAVFGGEPIARLWLSTAG